MSLPDTNTAPHAGRCARRRASSRPEPKYASARSTRCRAPRRGDGGAFAQRASSFWPAGAGSSVCSGGYNNPLNKADPLGLRPCDWDLYATFTALYLDGPWGGGCDQSHLDRTLACFGSFPGYHAPWNPSDDYSPTWADTYYDHDGGWFGYLGLINTCVVGGFEPQSSAWALVDAHSPESIIHLGDMLKEPCDPHDVGCLAWIAVSEAPIAVGVAGFAFGSFGRPRPLGQTPCRSFAPDTLVVMANGTTKPISGIEGGEQVLATDPETGQTTARQVLAVWATPHDGDLLDIAISGADGTEGVVETTDGHKFWSVTVEGWVEAQHLTVGEALRQPDGTTASVVTLTPQAGAADMWDLTIATDHTFYVTYTASADEAVLVHNCNYQGWRGTNMTRQQSFDYHFSKHGAGVTPERYTADARAWRDSVGLSQGKSIRLADGSVGYRFRTPGGGLGGILDGNKNIITFWYR